MRSFVERLFGQDIPPTVTTRFNDITSMQIVVTAEMDMCIILELSMNNF